ncbi:CBS domain-containing protein [Streptomyces sp. NPDC051561]|uniref:CBS domain-containing protein n=1 Tax=Streptomyces sp. NPDC051561 TaxID=3365658 RepID=UPI0037991C1D
MHAGDLAQPCTTLPWDCDALEAARTLAFGTDPHLVLVAADGTPRRVLHGTEFIRLVLPEFVVAQPGLTALYGLDGPHRLKETLAGRRIGPCLAAPASRPLVVAPSATLTQVMLALVGSGSQLVVVVSRERDTAEVVGVITARDLLAHVLSPPGGQGEPALERSTPKNP